MFSTMAFSSCAYSSLARSQRNNREIFHFIHPSYLHAFQVITYLDLVSYLQILITLRGLFSCFAIM